jgi:hypothetical protein
MIKAKPSFKQRIQAHRWSTTGLAVLLAAALIESGILVGNNLIPASAPPSLADPPVIDQVDVTFRQFDDPRLVEVDLILGSELNLIAPVAGIITAFECAANAALQSGTAPLHISGQPVVAIATSAPLWRDLELGISGDDVTSLHNELSRLGYNAPTGNKVTAETFTAVETLLLKVGTKTADKNVISMSQFVWIPEDGARVATCQAAMGQSVTPGQPVAALRRILAAAQVTLPTQLTPGQRVLQVENVATTLDSNGQVSSVGLADLMASNAYRLTLLNNPDLPTLTGRVSLAESIKVAVVPPGALYKQVGTTACVLSGGTTPVPVEVVASELGQTLVRLTKQQNIQSVTAKPVGAGPCT